MGGLGLPGRCLGAPVRPVHDGAVYTGCLRETVERVQMATNEGKIERRRGRLREIRCEELRLVERRLVS